MIAPVRKIYDNYGFKTKILACGRYPRLFGEIAVAGADICTMRMEFMRLLYEHSFTEAADEWVPEELARDVRGEDVAGEGLRVLGTRYWVLGMVGIGYWVRRLWR